MTTNLEKTFITFLLILANGATVSAQNIDNKGLLKLNDSTTIKMPDVFVSAQRPILKVVAGRL